MTTFVTAAFCLVRDGRLLTVRKTGSSRFMLPGVPVRRGRSLAFETGAPRKQFVLLKKF